MSLKITLKQEKKSDITQHKMFKWLLQMIIVQFERSVGEIAYLMNDSFSRFKRGDTDLYMKLSQLSSVEPSS